MSHVTTHYRVIQVAGHHRQPRSSSSWLEPTPPSGAEVVPGTVLTPYAPASIAFTANGQTAIANFVFWSATDGTDGQTTTNPTLNQTVGSSAMELTAWYLPVGGDGTGESGWIIDAFSDALGDFVDDTFVTVTSDATLTSDANVVGFVPTPRDETVDAVASIHTGETFEHWIGGSAAADVDTFAARTSGYAIATYHRNHISIPKPNVSAEEGWLILFGIINDAPGLAIHLGGGGGPVPIDPGWGSFVNAVAKAAGIVSLGAGLREAAELNKIALNEVQVAVKQLQARQG